MKAKDLSRRKFMAISVAGVGILSSLNSIKGKEAPIQGFDQTQTEIDGKMVWKPFTDRKIKVGIVGYGACGFGAAFGYQNHPNVDVVAVSDLFSDRCAKLAELCRCKKTYPSLEEMVKDDSIEAIYLATDAPNHVNHVLKVLEKGKHVVCAVPALWGNLEDAERLLEAVKKSGKIYALNETSAFRDNVYAARKIYQAGGFGKMVFTEGEYYHYFPTPFNSYLGWRVGLPPQWYPTHSNAFYTCVTGGRFTEVTCFGHKSSIDQFQPQNNPYKNQFGSEIALFRSSEGGAARMAVCWDTPGNGAEAGRNRGELGSFDNQFFGNEEGMKIVNNLNLKKPALPPGMDAGGHGGSHAFLTVDFIDAILRNRKPCVDIITALNTTIPGVIAHLSALKDGETMKIPSYKI